MARHELYDLEIHEWSGVGAPAHKPAKAAIMKRRDKQAPPKQPTPKAGEPIQKELAALLTSETDGHQHGISIQRYSGSGRVEIWCTYAQGPDDESGHTHAIAKEPSGSYVLSMTAGHTHTIKDTEMASALLALTTKGQGPMADDGTQGGGDGGGDDKLQKQVDRLTKILGLNADERAHFDKLEDTDAQDAFLEKSADDRQAEIKEVQKTAEDADPVVYTTKAGIPIRKSAGEAVIAALKTADDNAREHELLKAEREQDRLEKRAEEELPYLPGDVKTRAAMLKQVDAIEDEDVRKAAHESLKAQNEAMSKAFETHGVGSDVPGSPEDKLDKMAKRIQERDDGTYHEAYAKATETPEGERLLTESVEKES